jgi:hypothetical protein
MGFVYNNAWEAFCRTYLELNGYFVVSNIFIALTANPRPRAIDEFADVHYGLEADIVAYKVENTDLGEYTIDLPHPSDGSHGAEFFAGENQPNNLVYCEIKANLSRNQQAIRDLLEGQPSQRIRQKAWLIEERFRIKPRIVAVAYYIDDRRKQRIAEAGWLYKEFPAMFHFMVNRFRQHMPEKGRVQYNDPWLGMMQFLECLHRDDLLHGLLCLSGIAFEGGPGDTLESAVIIRGAPNHTVGVQSEYRYLTEKFGQHGTDWELQSQALLEIGTRHYDEMSIKLSDGTQKSVFFDLTDFFGKW